jgi:hypothetical protein
MMKKVLSAKDILSNNFLDRFKNAKSHITEEFQDFGFRLAVKLDDASHKALYIKFAKEIPRSVLEETMEFTLDYPLKNGKRAKIFMWRLNQICKEKNIKMSWGFKKKELKPKKTKPQLELFTKQ